MLVMMKSKHHLLILQYFNIYKAYVTPSLYLILSKTSTMKFQLSDITMIWMVYLQLLMEDILSTVNTTYQQYIYILIIICVYVPAAHQSSSPSLLY